MQQPAIALIFKFYANSSYESCKQLQLHVLNAVKISVIIEAGQRNKKVFRLHRNTS